MFPEQVFDGKFLDESIARFYQDDERLSATTKFFGLLSIIISCLGLFGLATHAAAQRIKEIGVRKVLGATIGQIVLLLSRDFLGMVFIALIIATPIAAYFMNSWLDNFVFRTTMPWWVFVLSGTLAIFIALLTVSYQSVRAAIANPIDSLRDE
jgi:putative ABC transport system permease protein